MPEKDSLMPRAYPEIFRGRGFEIFLYGRENLGEFGIFFLKNSSKLKKFPKKGRGFDPQNHSLNTLLTYTFQYLEENEFGSCMTFQ